MLKKLLFYILCFLIPPNLSNAFTNEQLQILEYVNKHGGYYKKDIAAIIIQESFVGNKVKRTGDNNKAYGIGQMHLPTAKHILTVNNKPYKKQEIKNKLLTDDEYAVKMVVKYYRYLMKKFKYDRKKAILAYNVGPTKLKRTGLKFDPNDYLNKVLSYRKLIVMKGIV